MPKLLMRVVGVIAGALVTLGAVNGPAFADSKDFAWTGAEWVDLNSFKQEEDGSASLRIGIAYYCRDRGGSVENQLHINVSLYRESIFADEKMGDTKAIVCTGSKTWRGITRRNRYHFHLSIPEPWRGDRDDFRLVGTQYWNSQEPDKLARHGVSLTS